MESYPTGEQDLFGRRDTSVATKEDLKQIIEALRLLRLDLEYLGTSLEQIKQALPHDGPPHNCWCGKEHPPTAIPRG